MTRTPQGFVDWCRANPTDNLEPGASWDQKCGSLVFRAGGFSTSAPSAYLMALATEGYGHHLYTEDEIPFDEIPGGWFVYFDKAGPNNGHIGMVSSPGRFLSANWRVSDFGSGLGTMPIADYAAISDRFMGASPYFINSTLAGVSEVASLDTKTIGKKRMSALIRNYDTSVGLVTEDGELVPLHSVNEMEALKATGIVGDFVQMSDGNVWNTLTAITARKIAQRSTVDPAVIASAIAPLLVSAVIAGLNDSGAELTQAQVEQAAETAIRKVFADAAS
ncbi:hypothetical protein [Glaciibacter superstes]|uniref:hypothetical protein n=1 Tax=Glaciibacter superstes TaxID=501023 RepID=UPI0003B7AEA3|nr:hypothetical protein [Glaciibacter superstes]